MQQNYILEMLVYIDLGFITNPKNGRVKGLSEASLDHLYYCLGSVLGGKMKNIKNTLKKLFYIVVAILIPGLLILNAIQAERYMQIQREVEALEQKQIQLVEENKKLIIDISLLSSGQRIGNIAENELGMHKAEGDEIIRVEMEKRK